MLLRVILVPTDTLVKQLLQAITPGKIYFFGQILLIDLIEVISSLLLSYSFIAACKFN